MHAHCYDHNPHFSPVQLNSSLMKTLTCIHHCVAYMRKFRAEGLRIEYSAAIDTQRRNITTALLLFALVGDLFASKGNAFLLKDTNFSEGFGAAFIYGSEYSGGRRPPLGRVLKYRDISPWQVFLIPDGPVKKVGVKTHPWDFQEGLHHNFKDSAGRAVRELHAHRLVVNHTIEENSPQRLQFAQFNNYRLPKDHPDRDKKLVKRVTTNRNGKLRIYYNSKNEIRNAATAHSAKWARDTWPHFLVNQRMTEPIPLADFEQLEFRVSFQVDQMNKLSNWPNAIRGAARSGMNLKFMFFLRNPDALDQKLFAGLILFASNQKRYAPHLGVEQHGNIFYRDSITSNGDPDPKLSERRTVNVDVRELVAEAIRQGREKQPELSASIEQYAIYNFSIGFEGMGHWETEAEISGLSLKGQKRNQHCE